MGVITYLFIETSELHIRGETEDNSKIIFLISQQKHVLWPLIRTVCNDGSQHVLKELYGKISLLPFHIWSTEKEFFSELS